MSSADTDEAEDYLELMDMAFSLARCLYSSIVLSLRSSFRVSL